MLTITKIKPQIEQAELLSEIAEEIDAYGAAAEAAQPILDKIAALQGSPVLAALAKARKALEARVDALPVDDDCEDHVEKGAAFEATIGKRGRSREIKDMAEAKWALGDQLFMTLATIKLGDLDKYLTPPQLEKVVKVKRTAHAVKVARRV
jgi:hypothetical protein